MTRKNSTFHLWTFIVLLSLLCFCPSLVIGYQYPIRLFAENEVPNIGDPHGMMQDSRGFIWFWGDQGAAFYNGNHFERLSIEDGLPDKYVYTIVEDEAGVIFFCTFKGLVEYHVNTGEMKLHDVLGEQPVRDLVFMDGVRIYALDSGVQVEWDNQHFEVPMFNPETQHHYITMIHTLVPDYPNHTIYALSDRIGVYQCHIPPILSLLELTPEAERKDLPHSDPLVFPEGFLLEEIAEVQNDLSDFVISDPEERMALWNQSIHHYSPFGPGVYHNVDGLVLRQNHPPLFWVNDDYFQIEEVAVPVRNMDTPSDILISSAKQTFEGGILYATNAGAYYVNNGNTFHFGQEEGLPSSRIAGAIMDHTGSFWFLDEQGTLSRIHTSSMSVFTRETISTLEGLQNAIALDDGSILLGGLEGISLYSDGEVSPVRSLTQISRDFLDFAADKHGNVLIFTLFRIYHYNRTTDRLRALTSELPAHDEAFTYATDGEGDLWFTFSNQLYEWDGSRLINHPTYEGWMAGSLSSLYTPDGSLFLGEWEFLIRKKHEYVWFYGFNRCYFGYLEETNFEPGQATFLVEEFYPDTLFLGKPAATCSELGPDGAYWFGTFSAGLLRLAPPEEIETTGDSIRIYDIRNGLPSNSVHSVFKAPDSTLYFVMDGGICKVTADSIEIINDPLPEESVVFQFLQDRNGRRFYATSHGLHVFEGHQKIILDNSFGLPENRVNQVLYLETGEMLAVQPNGIFLFHPDNLMGSLRTGNPPVIASLWADSLRIGIERQINLPLGRRKLLFNLALPDYLNEPYNRFSWYLSGLDGGFQQSTTRSEAIYTNIPPGTHTFQLHAINSAGDTLRLQEEPQIYVPYYYYETTGFYLVLIFISVGIIVLIFYWRFQTLKKEKERELELQEARLETAHQLAATIAHEFNNPLAIIKGAIDLFLLKSIDEKVKERHMQRIPGQVERMADLVQKLLRLSEIREIDYAYGVQILDLHSPAADEMIKSQAMAAQMVQNYNRENQQDDKEQEEKAH